MFAWTNAFDGRTYAVLVDDEEFTDVDILDITDPRNPFLVNDTLDLVRAVRRRPGDAAEPDLGLLARHDVKRRRQPSAS